MFSIYIYLATFETPHGERDTKETIAELSRAVRMLTSFHLIALDINESQL